MSAWWCKINRTLCALVLSASLLPQQADSQASKSESSAPYDYLSFLPNAGITNLVASYTQGGFGPEEDTAFQIDFYDSKAVGEIAKDTHGLDWFLDNGNFDIIKVYESINGRKSKDPLVVIYRQQSEDHVFTNSDYEPIATGIRPQKYSVKFGRIWLYNFLDSIPSEKEQSNEKLINKMKRVPTA